MPEMNEMGGPAEGFNIEDGVSGAPEQLSEQAKERFAENAAAMKRIRKEEKQSKKRDDQVAQTIIKFLSTKDHAHLFLLISRLVGRDCPSIFILAILSIIDEGAREQVKSYLNETVQRDATDVVDKAVALTKNDELDADTNKTMMEWVTRMQMVLATKPDEILMKLMLDEKNIDGSVLQLTTFVLQEFFKMRNQKAEFEKIQPLTAGILQTVFEPFMANIKKKLLDQAPRNEDDDENDDS